MTAREGVTALGELLEAGESLAIRAADASRELASVADTYRRWTNMLDELAIDLEGAPEDLARDFLRLRRLDEAFAQFQRLGAPLGGSQIELGLEILARQRRRDDYDRFLTEHRAALAIHHPDFVHLNQSVRLFTQSVAWIQIDYKVMGAAGSGFFLGPRHVATNRHVVATQTGESTVSPEAVRVVTSDGTFSVVSIHVPREGPDDVAILTLGETAKGALPLHLGFSELVELGDRVLTIGFPAPEGTEFANNLYCNIGLVNRLRASDMCSERVLEVSIPLHGGISGAPLLDEAGQVVGQVTFSLHRHRSLEGGSVNLEQSFYAIPVEVLRRLWAQVER